MNIIGNDLLGALLVIGFFSATIAAAETWARLRQPDPEWPRKFVHIAGGLGCLLFPFVIERPIVVTAMAFFFAAIFFFGGKSDRLRCLSGVRRKSRGSEYYPFAIAFLFFVSQDRMWLYFTSVLILTLADAGAALIGARFGKLRYRVGGETKSLAGSMIFLGIAFAVMLLLLDGLTDLGMEKSILISFLVGVLLTGIEAISIGGTDNVFVPVMTCYILLKITTKAVEEIRFQCLSMVLIFLVLLAASWLLDLFPTREFIVFFIFTYGTWSLGSVDWSLPVFICFGFYCLWVIFGRKQERQKGLPAVPRGVVLPILLVPLGLLVVANASGRYPEFYGSYLLAVFLPTLIAIRSRFLPRQTKPSWAHAPVLVTTGVVTGVVLGLLVAFHQPGVSWKSAVIIPAIGAGALCAFEALGEDDPDGMDVRLWGARVQIVTLAGVGLIFALEAAGWIPLWAPRY